MTPHPVPLRWTVVLPVKRADRAKSRLAELEGAGPALARAIALDTIAAVAACTSVARIVVITDDESLAASVPGDVVVLDDRQRAGTNPAVLAAMATIADSEPRAALLADLPALRPPDLADALLWAGRVDRAVVADAEGEGSTLVTARTGVSWLSSFGDGSFGRHLALGCVPLGLGADSSVRRDVDTPAHLALAAGVGLGPRTSSWWDRAAICT